MRISERTELRKAFNWTETQHLKTAARILRRLEGETDFGFSYETSFDDAADAIDELIGYASGAYQYEQAIGPDTRLDAYLRRLPDETVDAYCARLKQAGE